MLKTETLRCWSCFQALEARVARLPGSSNRFLSSAQDSELLSTAHVLKQERLPGCWYSRCNQEGIILCIPCPRGPLGARWGYRPWFQLLPVAGAPDTTSQLPLHRPLGRLAALDSITTAVGHYRYWATFMRCAFAFGPATP